MLVYYNKYNCLKPTYRRFDDIMNKLIRNCVLGVIASITLGLSTVALGAKQNVTQANAITGSMHFYTEVTSEADLHVGDTILIFTTSGRTFDCAAGNPRFYRMNYVSGVNGDVTRVYADESQVKRFQLGEGVQDSKSTEISTGIYKPSFSLKLLDHPGFADLRGKYLNHTEDRNAVLPHDKGSVGYYMTPICFKDFTNGAVDGHASWEFFYQSSNHVFHITRQDERDKANYSLCYRGSNTRPALDYNYETGGMRVLKEISLSSELIQYNPIVVTTDPNRNKYYVGDIPDLSGLEISLHFKDESVADVFYDNEPDFFKATSKVQHTSPGSSDGMIVMEYCGISFRVLVDIIEEVTNTNSYCLLSGELDDYRGTYIAVGNLVSEYYGFKQNIVDTTPSTTAHFRQTIDYDNSGIIQLEINEFFSEQGLPFKIERLTVGGQSRYFIHVNDGYLSFSTGEGDLNGALFAKSKESLTANDAITIDSNHHVLMNGRTFVLSDSGFFGFSTNSSGAVKLFKLMPSSDYETHIDNFMTTFIDDTASACLAENVTSSLWADLADEFALLTVDEQGYYARLSYTHGMEDTNSVENVVDRYDYIVAKYEYDDFMNRKDAGTWKDYFNYEDDTLPPDETYDPSRVIGTEVSTSVIALAIIITSILSLSTVSFFIIRKKHK